MSRPSISANEQISAELECQTEKAYELWRSRQDRSSHPAGNFDNQSRWYPAAAERQPCCDAIRSPSAAYPYSLMTHCRSVEHIANPLRCGRLANFARVLLKTKNPRSARVAMTTSKPLPCGMTAFLSIYDGKTEYVLGETVTSRARQDHNGGIYVYRTEQEAREAHVPSLIHAAGCAACSSESKGRGRVLPL